MKSYGFVLSVAFGIGLALVGPLVWHIRNEIALGWREQFGVGDDDADSLVKERLETLQGMEPFHWGITVLLAAIVIVTMFVFGTVVAYGGVALCVVGTVVIIALIVLFNVLLFAQFPPLLRGGVGAARK
jgi:hypothetical protein